MKIPFLILALALWCQSVGAQALCNAQLKELREYAMASRYEQLPESQKPNFMAQLSPADRLGLMGAISGHKLGTAINNAAGGDYRSTITDVFNRKTEEFKKSCGFMLK